jgi:hypothetical protein
MDNVVPGLPGRKHADVKRGDRALEVNRDYRGVEDINAKSGSI